MTVAVSNFWGLRVVIDSICILVQDAVVKRVDEGLGLVLEVPTEPTPSPGFVHISNVADAKIDKLQQVCACSTLFIMLKTPVWPVHPPSTSSP